MKRRHLRWHRRAWPVLALAAALLIAAALFWREAAPITADWPTTLAAEHA